MNALKSWYVDEGYSLARISGPNRITANGKVQLRVQEGAIKDIQIVFLDDDASKLFKGPNLSKKAYCDTCLRTFSHAHRGEEYD